MADSAVTIITPAAPAERLPLSTKLAFGAGDLAPAIATIIISFFQLFFLITVAGLNPLAASSIRTLLTIWDAVNDPIVGWLSDRTRSRWGRRRPWILFGAVPFGIIFFLQWIVPPFDDTGKFIYYVVVGVLFNMAFTIVNVPYTALTPELTQDYDERTSLNAFRFAFSIGGSLIIGVLHQIVVGGFADERTGYTVAGALWGAVCIPPLLWCFLGTRERFRSADEEQVSLGEQLRTTFSNRPYLFVIGIYLFSWLAIQVTSSVLAFYVTYWLGSVPQFPLQALGLTFARPQDIIPIMLLAVQGSALVFLFVWNAVCRRIGKKAIYMIGMTFWIAVQAVLFFVQPQQVTLAVVLAVLAGVGVATGYIVPWSMMPDVIEYDELRTGKRREGMYYGLMVLLQKFGLAIGLFLVGAVLAATGFSEDLLPGEQPASALLALRWMIGPVPTIVLLCGMVLTAFYPLTKAKHAEIMAQLAARKAAEGTG
jgi:glycoside/pentoside/hexuronide:cation symporter, GPH family